MHRGAAEINEMGLLIGSYGMGWISTGTGKSRIAWHSGDVPNYKAFMALVPKQKKGMVLLFNANHPAIKLTLDEVMLGAAQLIAGVPPTPPHLPMLPWTMPGMLLIPLLQIAGVIGTLRSLRRLRRDAGFRPSRRRMWGQHILLPLIPNLAVALTLIPLLGKMRGFLRLYTPDYAWLAPVCSAFAGFWTILRTGLMLQTMRKSSV
jgi:hypothetical protein